MHLANLEVVNYGRSHDERRQKRPHERRTNTPTDSDTDLEVNPWKSRGGSDVAPTQLAAVRERVRHHLERDLGRTPAGEDGLLRDRRSPSVTRKRLDEVAREADRLAVGRPIKRR